MLNAVGTEDIAFTVPYKKAVGGDHAAITLDIQGKITAYVDSLLQGEPIIPTDWQAAIQGDNQPTGVDYYDEDNLEPATIQTITATNIWNITLITVTEI